MNNHKIIMVTLNFLYFLKIKIYKIKKKQSKLLIKIIFCFNMLSVKEDLEKSGKFNLKKLNNYTL